MAKARQVTLEWIEYVLYHTRVDFSTGEVYWAFRMRGRKFGKPIGCLDRNGYVKMKIANRSTYGHRIVWLHAHETWPEIIDHINRVPHDNRLENLRESCHRRNAVNSKVYVTNTTGVKGVSQIADGRYKVTVCGVYYGYYETLREAEEIANAAYSQQS